jgi:hypothetical protein
VDAPQKLRRILRKNGVTGSYPCHVTSHPNVVIGLSAMATLTILPNALAEPVLTVLAVLAI